MYSKKGFLSSYFQTYIDDSDLLRSLLFELLIKQLNLYLELILEKWCEILQE